MTPKNSQINRKQKQQVRIIAGEHRGRKLPVLDADGLRPTTDRVRETLFNWLMHDVRGARCLDLFAGSGALGFECLSRGAKHVQFVEKNRRAALGIEENISRLSEGENAAIYSGSADRYLLMPVDSAFDLVFLDPPFDEDLLTNTAFLLESTALLGEGALIYIEHRAKRDTPEIPVNWHRLKHASVGQSSFGIWQRLTPE